MTDKQSPIEPLEHSCVHDRLDFLSVECYLGKDRDTETVAIETNTGDEVHLDRARAAALHALLGRFLDATA